LHHSDAIESDGSVDDDNDDDAASETPSNARPDGSGEDAESKKEKMIADLTTRIRSALRKKFPPEQRERKKMKKKLQRQTECTDVAVSDPNARCHRHLRVRLLPYER
jgi:hypothetical protein